MRIAGSTVLLTGVTGGIGRTIAHRLASAGADLVLTGRRREVLEPLAAEFGARSVVADIADPKQVTRLAEECAGTDILVANAALPSSGELLDYTPEQVDRAIDVNLRAPVMLARLLAPRMVDSGRGHLVFVGSMSGKAATPSSSLYNATKFGLRGFAHGFRQDLHGTGVGVSIVQPGFVSDAGMFAETGAKAPGGLGTVTPGKVAAGVLRAVERDLCEVNVAPLMMRLGCAVAAQFPGFAEKVQRRSNSEGTIRQIVESQRASR